ncbi:dihydroneopterin aldolase [Marinobacteraceae bacterium S3BR75-40.1]
MPEADALQRETTLDKVTINSLAVEAVIGVYDWERDVRQRLLVDLELGWDNRQPGASDRVEDALDYTEVAAEVTRVLVEGRFQLLEAAVEALCLALQSRFGVPWLRVHLRKPGALPGADHVGVCIERGEG